MNVKVDFLELGPPGLEFIQDEPAIAIDGTCRPTP
jgi:hypothetical protein